MNTNGLSNILSHYELDINDGITRNRIADDMLSYIRSTVAIVDITTTEEVDLGVVKYEVSMLGEPVATFRSKTGHAEFDEVK